MQTPQPRNGISVASLAATKHPVRWLPTPTAEDAQLAGYKSLWFRQGGPGRRAIVVEPDPANLAVGRTNAALSGLQPDVIAGLVRQEPGPARPFATEPSGLLDVPWLPVPQILAERGIERLDFLHGDKWFRSCSTAWCRSDAPVWG